MKILHLSKYYHPYRGGIEKVIKELSEASLKKGYEVTVICASENDQREESYVQGVRVIRLPLLFTLFSQPLTPSIFKELKAEIDKCDVINVHTPNPLYELALILVKTSKPIILTYHCEVFKARLLNSVYRPVSQALLKKASKIIVGTSLHIEHSKCLQPYKDKCEIVPFGIEPKYSVVTEKTASHLRTIQQRYGSYFLFAGRMVPYKGVNILLKALSLSEDLQVVFIGTGKMLSEWKKLSEDLNLTQRAHFLGSVVDDEEFAAYIQGCRALVLPSINEAEAFGLVLLEAMSCAKPVITTNLNSGVRFVNRAGETGLMVPVSDEKRLAEALRKLHSDDILHAQMSRNAYKHFHDHFLIQSCSEKYESIYRSEIQRAA